MGEASAFLTVVFSKSYSQMEDGFRGGEVVQQAFALATQHEYHVASLGRLLRFLTAMLTLTNVCSP